MTDHLGTGSESFGYTAKGQLSSATGPWDTLGWSYDGVGNRLTRTLTDVSGTTTDTYTYGTSDNRLMSVSEGMTRSFTHDASGNVTYDSRSGTGYGYAYDPAGRMESLSVNGVTQAEYVYDARGQQVIRRLTQTDGTIHVVHDLAG